MRAWAVAGRRSALSVMVVVAQQRPMASIRRRSMVLMKGNSELCVPDHSICGRPGRETSVAGFVGPEIRGMDAARELRA
jgi:hypothetical protein